MEKCGRCGGCESGTICDSINTRLLTLSPVPLSTQHPPQNILACISSLVPQTPYNVNQAHHYLTTVYKQLEKDNPYSTESPQILFDEDMEKITKFRFHVLKQFRVFTCKEEDCKVPGGKRPPPAFIGMRGIRCLHCNTFSKVWRKSSNFLNSFDQISDHFEIGTKCKVCPQDIKSNLEVLKEYHRIEIDDHNLLGTQGIFYKMLLDKINSAV